MRKIDEKQATAKLAPGSKEALAAAFDASVAFLESLDSRPIRATADLATLRQRLHKELSEEGVAADQVIRELAGDVEGGILGSTGGRFFAWVIGGSLPSALAADWLTATWDQNAVLYATSPAAAVVEEVAGSWLKGILGLPTTASFALVSGCQLAHATCLAAARHALLTERGWNLEERGMFGAPLIRVYCSDLQHGSFERALRLLGFGRAQVRSLPANSLGQIQPEALEAALADAPSEPAVVLLQAGEINTGAFDDFQRVIPLAKRYDAWVHIDGAFGLWAATSRTYAHLTEGMELADSWATDGHKWLNVPFDCGYAFVRNAEAHRAAMSSSAPYLTHAVDARDPMDWNPEWSRRARGFSTYAALRELGKTGVAELIERCCKHAHALVTRIGNLPGAEVVWEPVLNQGLLRFLDTNPGASEEDRDRRTNEVIAAIVTKGEVFFGGTTWRGRRAMRVSVCNWRTTEEDVNRAVASIAQVLRQGKATPHISSQA